MGQYYTAVVAQDGKMPIGIDPKVVRGEFMPLKLMEHSWWFNQYVGTVVKQLHQTPMRVAWVGDYADEVSCDPQIYSAARGKKVPHVHLNEDVLLLDGKFLVNHIMEEFVDCDKYRRASTSKADPDWVIHPLPILTAIGNGLGGGDYFGTQMELAGRWAYDIISVEDARPIAYTELDCAFTEK